MISLSVKTNFPDVQRQLDNLRRDIGDQATAMALNKVADKGRTEMKRAITDEFNISSAEVSAALRIRRASAKGYNLVAVLEAFNNNKGRSLNLIHFVERKVTLAEARRRLKRGTLQQIGFKIKKTGGIKTIPGAFIANNGRTVFIREGKDRLPIKPLQVINISQMFNTRRINQRVIAKIQQEFPVEFERAMRVVLERFR